MAYSFGTSSLGVYEGLHKDLQLVLDVGIKSCRVDFSLHEGHRPVSKQFSYFKQGRELIDGKWVVVNQKAVITNIDGINVKGKHNYYPSLAVDITAYVPYKPQLKWDAIHLTYVAAHLIAIADQFLKEGEISHKVRWGGNWDMDGDLSDNNLYDRPHLELIDP